MSTNQNITRILYSVCSCIIGILIISFSTIIYFGFSTNNKLYMETLKNWEQSPIIDLEIIYDPLRECTDKQTSVFLYNWSGIEEGCLCTSSNQIMKGQCCSEDNLDDKQCCVGTPIKPISSKKIDLWQIQNTSTKDQSIQFRVCATRLLNYSFKNNSPRSIDCLASEKWCGKDINGEKDIDYGFCVPVNQQCPIQEILIGETNPNPKIYETIKIKEENGNKLHIFVNREGPAKLPLVDFRLSAGNTVCLDESENVSINLGYKLNKLKSKCTITDDSYANTGIQISEKSFLQSNQLSEQLESLPDFEYSSDKLSLYTKSYTEIKMSCRDSIFKFYDSVETLEKIKNLSKPLSILCFLYSSILIFFETWIGFKYNKFSWGVIICKKNVNVCLQLFYVMKYILFLVCNVLIIIEASYQVQINEFLNDIMNKQCMEETTSDLFTFLSKGKIKEFSLAILLCLWMHMLAEPNIFYIISKCCCSQIQQRMQQSINAYSVRKPNSHTQPAKEISIIIEKPEEKQLPQNHSFSYLPNPRSPTLQAKNPSQSFGGIKKTLSYKF